MTKPPHYWKKAKNYLSSKDKVMKNLIKRYDDTTLSTRKDVFYSLCKSIIGQQISVAAANSVYKKFNTACKGKITPQSVKKLGITKLKKCGLSKQKAKGVGGADLEEFMALEKIKQQEEELKQIMIYAGRPGLWLSLIHI